MYNPTNARSVVRDRLLADHRDLDDLLKRLIFAFEADARDDIQCLWADFESRLLAHMAAEERYLVPGVRSSHPAESQKLLGDHEFLRGKMAELGMQLELHLVRLETAKALVAALHAHAAYEDRIYQWADAELGDPERQSLLGSISQRIHSRRRRSGIERS